MGKGPTATRGPDSFGPVLPAFCLPLDPAKSPQGNLDDYFRKYKKYQNAQKAIRPRLQAAQAEAATLRERLASLDRDEAPAEEGNLVGAVRQPPPRRQKETPPVKPVLRVTTEASDAILEGRTSL